MVHGLLVRYKTLGTTLGKNSQRWCHSSIKLSCQGGVGFAPMSSHTKDIKIELMSTLFGAGHIRVRVGPVITFSC